MKQMKKLAVLLITVVLLASTPLTALAAGGYVPTKGTFYRLYDNEWKSSTKYAWSYKSNGKLTKYTATYTDGDVNWRTYTWKGNLITKVKYKDGDYSIFKYKNGKRVSYSTLGENNTKLTYKFKIKKNKATSKRDGYTTTTYYNGKNQITKTVSKYDDGTTSTTTYTYYSNGNRKSYKQVNSEGRTAVYKYNSKGYQTSSKVTSKDYTYSYSYKYKFNKKGQLKERISTYKEGTTTSQTKIVYTSWKKVSQVRNCDAYGYSLSLGG